MCDVRRPLPLALLLLALLGLASCAKDGGAPPPPPPPRGAAPAPDTGVHPDAGPAEPPSPLADARDVLKVYDFGDETLSALGSLRAYAVEFPRARDAAEAARLAAKTELDVLVRALHTKDAELLAGLAGRLESRATEPGPTAQAVAADTKRLFAALGWPENADEALAAAAEEAIAVADAVAAVTAGEGSVDVDKLSSILAGTGAYSGAARYFVAGTLVDLLEPLRGQRQDVVSQAFATPVARLLCASCEQAARDEGGDVTKSLLAGEPGVACAAIRDKTAGLGGQEAWALLASECSPADWGLQSRDQLIQMAGANFLPMRAYGLLALVAGAPPLGNDPMGRLIPQLVDPAAGNSEHPPVALGLAVPYVAPAEDAKDSLVVSAAPHGGPGWMLSPLETLIVDSAVRTAQRPVVVLSEGKVALEGGGDSLWPGREVVTLEALLAPPPEAPAGEAPAGEPPVHPGKAALAKGLQDLTASASELAGRHAGLAPTVSPPPEGGTSTPRRAAWVAAHRDTDAAALSAVVAGMVEAGYGRAWWLTGPGAHAYVPTAIGPLTSLPVRAVDLRYKRPTLVVLTPEGADVYPPAGSLGSARGARPGAPTALPKGAQPWYRGEELFKVSVALPKKGTGAARIVDTARFLAGVADAGNVVLLDGVAGVPASRLVEVAALLGTAPGPDWDTAPRVFKGLVCAPSASPPQADPEAPAPGGPDASPPEEGAREGLDPKADPGSASGTFGPCPTQAVVMFPGVDVPSAGNLTKEPVKKEVEKVPPKVEVKEEASAAFCNKGDIQRVMGGRSGAFKFCYERELQQNPDLEGRVVLRFNIDLSGDPQAIAIASSTLKSDAVHECLKANVKKLTFNKPDGGVCAVQWPLVFKN